MVVRADQLRSREAWLKDGRVVKVSEARVGRPDLAAVAHSGVPSLT